MANPLITQGTLNRLRGSVIIPSHPELNITAAYLGKEGISLSLEGETTLYIPTMTGAVTSAEPYQMCSVSINLLKTQFVSNLYKQRQELLSTIGDITVRPDTSTLGDYPLFNCAIRNVAELSFNGQDAGYRVTLGGYYCINNLLFDQA